MDNYATQQRKPGKHLLGFGLVVVLHLLLFWAIHSGLARSVVTKIKAPVEVILLSETVPDKPVPPPPKLPPPPQNLPPAPAYVPPPASPVASPMPAPNAVAAVTATPQAAAPTSPIASAATSVPSPTPAPAVKSESVRTAAVVNAANCEKPEYPSASRRMEEEGTVSLRFLVGADGKVIQSEVEKSSGFKRLDEAARAGLSRCQFRPASVDGKPEQAWASMRYTWRLE
jgi:periplasmic protein TonB